MRVRWKSPGMNSRPSDICDALQTKKNGAMSYEANCEEFREFWPISRKHGSSSR